MLHIFLSNRPGDVRYGTTGKPVPGYELRIVDEDGHAGRSRARSASCRSTGPTGADVLLEQPREEPRHLRRRLDAQRRQVHAATPTATTSTAAAPTTCSRCGGIYVSPFEVEAALMTHRAVLEAAVVGHADERRARQAQGLRRAQGRAQQRQRWPRSCRSTSSPARAVQVPALDRVRRRAAEDRHRQDPALQAARARRWRYHSGHHAGWPAPRNLRRSTS